MDRVPENPPGGVDRPCESLKTHQKWPKFGKRKLTFWLIPGNPKIQFRVPYRSVTSMHMTTIQPSQKETFFGFTVKQF